MRWKTQPGATSFQLSQGSSVPTGSTVPGGEYCTQVSSVPTGNTVPGGEYCTQVSSVPTGSTVPGCEYCTQGSSVPTGSTVPGGEYCTRVSSIPTGSTGQGVSTVLRSLLSLLATQRQGVSGFQTGYLHTALRRLQRTCQHKNSGRPLLPRGFMCRHRRGRLRPAHPCPGQSGAPSPNLGPLPTHTKARPPSPKANTTSPDAPT